MKRGKFCFEAKVNTENVCSLSDPSGDLATTWHEQWEVAVLKKSDYNPMGETWCVRNDAMISEVQIKFPRNWLTVEDGNGPELNVLKNSKTNSNQKGNRLRYITHMQLYITHDAMKL